MSFITNNKNNYSVKLLCKALKFPRSTYYEALVRMPSPREVEYNAFSEIVKSTFEENKGRYGAVKLQDMSTCHHEKNVN